jgi:hypothetical protein
MQNYIVTLLKVFFLSTITYYYYYFGEMEQHSLPREGFHAMVEKVATMFAKNDFPQKRTLKEYPTENYTFLPFFTYFYHFLYFAALWSPRDHLVASPPTA